MGKLTDAIYTATGKSGRKYNFGIYSMDTNFKAVGGIYIFTKREMGRDGKYAHTTVYCGRTEDLSARFNNHHKADDIREKGANCLCVLGVSTENVRTEIERDILGCTDNSFPCNDLLIP